MPISDNTIPGHSYYQDKSRQLYYIKSKEDCKDQDSINLVPHLTLDTIWESDKTQGNTTNKRTKRSAFPIRLSQAYNKQTRQYIKDTRAK